MEEFDKKIEEAKKLAEQFPNPQDYIAHLVAKAKAVVDEKPYLLRAFSDFMDVNHDKVDPVLEKTWEHNAAWLLHKDFMDRASKLIAQSPAYRDQINDLVGVMKLITQTVDLALLPKEARDEVEEWAKRYKTAFWKKKEEKDATVG